MSRNPPTELFYRATMAIHRSRSDIRPGIAVCLAAMLTLLAGCEKAGPVAPVVIPCEDPSVLKLAPRPVSFHNKPVRVRGKLAQLPGMTLASGEEVKAFFGGKPVKLVFTLDKVMYVLEYAG